MQYSKDFLLTNRKPSTIISPIRNCALPAGALSRFFFLGTRSPKSIPAETKLRYDTQAQWPSHADRIMFTSNYL